MVYVFVYLMSSFVDIEKIIQLWSDIKTKVSVSATDTEVRVIRSDVPPDWEDQIGICLGTAMFAGDPEEIQKTNALVRDLAKLLWNSFDRKHKVRGFCPLPTKEKIVFEKR